MAKLKVPVGKTDHVRGTTAATVTLVEYGDFQCPHCKIAYTTVSELQQRFGDDLRFVFRHYPLIEIHEMAKPAAEAAEFAASAGRFWEMYDALFQNQSQLSLALMRKLAAAIGLDGAAPGAAIERSVFQQRIETDIASGDASGVHGTPTYFLNGEMYEGARDKEELAAAIKALL